MTHAGSAVLLLLTLSACGQSQVFNRLSDPEGYWLPLTVDLRLDDSVREAGLSYTDACRQTQTLAIGDRVQETFTREIGKVFEHVNTSPVLSQKRPADGVVQVSLGLKELDLFAPRQGTRTYPATVTLGATIAYVDPAGTVLYTKNLRTDARGTVETKGQECTVYGLADLAKQAAGTLAQGLKKHLGTSTKVREAAQAGTEKPRTASSSTLASTMTNAAASAGAAAMSSIEPASLSFRVMLIDDSQDHVLQSGESISLEVEVNNAGPNIAKGVALSLSGTPLLTQQFTSPVTVGDMQPGEIKRVSIQGTAPNADAVEQAELIISVEAAGPGAGAPHQKKFQIALEPNTPASDQVQTVDVDQIPERVPGYERPKAVGIAVGVGTFRNADVPGVQFAAHDAEVIAEYFRTVTGIAPERIRVATDEHALKDDLAELFEAWLPEQVVPGSAIFIFLAGRASVNPATGVVSLIPYEADPTSTQRLFSLRRLHDALARLPIQQAVIMMDLTLNKPSSTSAPNGKAPAWSAVPLALRGDKLVQVIGVNGRQEAHQYEEGRHGLFTYYLLKGLGGEADRDLNGVIVIGELCRYVREQVLETAKEKFNNAQEPACLPPLSSKAKAWLFPLGRVK